MEKANSNTNDGNPYGPESPYFTEISIELVYL